MPFDSTPQVTPALVLLRAARARIEDPRNWVKHAPWEWEQKAGLNCAVSSFATGTEHNLALDAWNILSQALPPAWAGRSIWQFNDAPETTHADIMMLFDRAERRLMEGGA